MAMLYGPVPMVNSVHNSLGLMFNTLLTVTVAHRTIDQCVALRNSG